MATLYSNADDLRNSGLVHVETQDGGGLAFTPTATVIPAGYRDIVISGQVWTSHSTLDEISVALNGDAVDANYNRNQIVGRSTALNSYGAAGASFGTCQTTGTSSGGEGSMYFRVTIPEYAGTVRQKMMITHSGFKNTNPDMYQYHHAVTWEDTDAVTSVTLFAVSAATFAAGSSFTVWVR
jgi:hypothetical protein